MRVMGNMNKKYLLIALFLSCFSLLNSAKAEVTEINITSVESPTYGGRSFADVGQYEKLTGRMTVAVDPKHPLNFNITHIHNTPTNKDGLVEFSFDIEIIKPIDLSKGNKRIIYDVANRGGPLLERSFNDVPPRARPNTPESGGNGFFQERGYTLVVSGWQAPYPIQDAPLMGVGLGSRIPNTTGRLTADLPIAKRADGTPVTGTNRESFGNQRNQETFTGYLTYPSATTDSKNGLLRIKQRDADPWQIPQQLSWRYIDEWRVEINAPLSLGFNAGTIYEFTYQAKDPIVYGLAFVSMRDALSFLRYESKDNVGNKNPLAINDNPVIEKVIGYGASQSGRTIKNLVYEFNEDEQGRMVLDGANVHISGASMNSQNFADFATPGQKSGQHGIVQQGDQFPFSYATSYDPLSRRTDGLLAKCRGSNTCAKIFHTDSENEFWHGGWLVYTDTLGNDLPQPDNVRIYHITGTQHSAARGLSKGNCQNIQNPVSYTPLSRAILVALDEWISTGKQPPASNHPTIKDGTLVSKDKVNWPAIPNSIYTGISHIIHVTDYNTNPPILGNPYPVFGLQVDQDGIALAGIKLPQVAVPTATVTGWNLRAQGFAEGELCMASGSYLPFAKTKSEREKNNDPRLSIAERYQSQQDYVNQISEVAKQLVDKRLLLRNDAEAIIENAGSKEVAEQFFAQ